jgi:tripartite-type tricarboxylate transporter receptor subunit TctC
VSGNARSAVLPDVPTFDEQGVTGYEAGNWIGLAAPAGTPPAIVARLNKEISIIQDSAEFKSKLDADGAVVVKYTPAEFSSFMQHELEKWGGVVRQANIKAE